MTSPGLPDGLPPIVHGTWIACPPDRVWECLSTAAGWDAWFTSGSQIEVRPRGDGTSVRVTESGYGTSPREVEAWMSCAATRSKPATEGRAAPRGRGRHAGESSRGSSIPRNRSTGWGEELTLLEFRLEHGVRYGTVPPAGR